MERPPPNFLKDGPEDAPWTLILAHGAGAPMDSDVMTGLAQRLGEAGVRVLRFEFPYMAERRTTGKKKPPDREPKLLDAWRAAVEAARATLPAGARLALGGKSMGGRMASLIADEVGADALICIGYPFHPPGKPDRLRTAHLEEIRTPTLIRQGERDPFGRREEAAGYNLSAAVHLSWATDGDHDLKPRKASGLTHAEALDQAVDATVDFLRNLPQ